MTAVLILLAAVLALVVATGLLGAGPTRVRRRTIIERPVRRRTIVERPVRRRRIVEEAVEDRPVGTRDVVE
ncbi:MAG: hypothetical protein ACXWB2_22470 [Acidimicrobiales bacterium]